MVSLWVRVRVRVRVRARARVRVRVCVRFMGHQEHAQARNDRPQVGSADVECVRQSRHLS